MIRCPNCQHEELDGAIFCSECGAQLIGGELVTQNIQTAERQAIADTTRISPKPTPRTTSAWLSLHLLDSGKIIPLPDQSEFSLGRVSEGQPIMPDIDLTPYQAYACGVSRLHAVIRRSKDGVKIMDLGSSNGTYVNGKRLEPNVEQRLSHGDVIALGKLRIQILLKR
ncbi:MAG: FHA domain-containing protein [Anaerolineae bacterium]|nr:MAG: FHA domain-containing protein [Anaerolineae bacterium]